MKNEAISTRLEWFKLNEFKPVHHPTIGVLVRPDFTGIKFYERDR